MSTSAKDALERLAESLEARGDGLTRRVFGVSIKAGSIDENARSVRVVASTEALDSYDEIVDQSWDLTRYERNPVVLYSHNSIGFLGPMRAEDTLPIGSASDVRVVNGALEATLSFVDAAANPMAERVWQGFRQGSLRAVSVGFRPRDRVAEMRDGVETIRLKNNELFEISAVPIPANAEAVARANQSAQRRNNNAAEAEENTMLDEKQIAALTAENAALKAASETHAKALGEAEKRASEAEQSRDEAKAAAQSATERAAKAEAGLIKAEVQALVGKKITPAQVDDFVKLRSTDKGLFDSMVGNLADLPLLEDVVKADPQQNNLSADPVGGGSDDLVAHLTSQLS